MFTSILGDTFTIAGVYAVNPRTESTTGRLQSFVVRADVETIMLEEEEKDMRINNPAVKDAWDQYQMILRLSRKKN
jgi:hypothetical protein